MLAYLYKVWRGEFNFVLTIPSEDLTLLSEELFHLAKKVKVMLAEYSKAIDLLIERGNNSNTLTIVDKNCLWYADTLDADLKRGRIIERELLRNNPRFKSQIIEELRMWNYLNTRW